MLKRRVNSPFSLGTALSPVHSRWNHSLSQFSFSHPIMVPVTATSAVAVLWLVWVIWVVIFSAIVLVHFNVVLQRRYRRHLFLWPDCVLCSPVV